MLYGINNHQSLGKNRASDRGWLMGKKPGAAHKVKQKCNKKCMRGAAFLGRGAAFWGNMGSILGKMGGIFEKRAALYLFEECCIRFKFVF